jgi:hypothetical protein
MPSLFARPYPGSAWPSGTRPNSFPWFSQSSPLPSLIHSFIHSFNKLVSSTKKKETPPTKNVGRMWGKRNPHTLLVGM